VFLINAQKNTFYSTPQHGLDELLDETFRIAPERVETDGLADRPSIQPKASWAYHHSTCSVEQSQPAERDDLYVKPHHGQLIIMRAESALRMWWQRTPITLRGAMFAVAGGQDDCAAGGLPGSSLIAEPAAACWAARVPVRGHRHALAGP
jgi:hypothetical protein